MPLRDELDIELERAAAERDRWLARQPVASDPGVGPRPAAGTQRGWALAVLGTFVALLGFTAARLVARGDPSPRPTKPARTRSASRVAATPPGPPPTVCSSDADVRSSITVANASAEPVAIWWVDRSCRERPLGSIPGHGTLTREQYQGHPWRIRSEDSQSLLLEIPPARDEQPRTFTFP